MKVLVTGSTGLLGTAIQKVARAFKYDFVFASRTDADFEQPGAAEQLVTRVQPDCIVHTAAVVGGIRYNIESPQQLRDRNRRINNEILQSAYLLRTKKVISFLSTCIFSDESAEPWDETMVLKGKPDQRQWGYAWAKRELALKSRHYTIRSAGVCRFVTLMPSTLYGPNDNFHPERSHVLPAILLKLQHALGSGEPPVFWGSGAPRREFLFSEDMAQVALWAIEHYDDLDPLIVAPSKDEAIQDVVHQVAKLMKYQGEIRWDRTKPDGRLSRRTNPTKFRKWYPAYRFTPLGNGLRATLKHFEENVPNLRGLGRQHSQ